MKSGEDILCDSMDCAFIFSILALDSRFHVVRFAGFFLSLPLSMVLYAVLFPWFLFGAAKMFWEATATRPKDTQ